MEKIRKQTIWAMLLHIAQIINFINWFLNTQQKENMRLTIISPIRDEQYILAEVLAKGLYDHVDYGKIEIELQHICFYRHKDYIIKAEHINSIIELWDYSIDFVITGIIPVHITKHGKLSIGFGCECDQEHGGQFPSKAPPSDLNWAKYKETRFGKILIFNSDNKQQTIHIRQMLDDKESCNVLIEIIQRIINKEFFKNYNLIGESNERKFN